MIPGPTRRPEDSDSEPLQSLKSGRSQLTPLGSPASPRMVPVDAAASLQGGFPDLPRGRFPKPPSEGGIVSRFPGGGEGAFLGSAGFVCVCIIKTICCKSSLVWRLVTVFMESHQDLEVVSSPRISKGPAGSRPHDQPPLRLSLRTD